jgi:tetratricopeptide (TPR) repeat protein
MKRNYNRYVFFTAFVVISLFSCKKQDAFLDAKPDDALSVPASLNDVENLLRYESLFNQAVDPSLGAATVDEYYVPSSVWTVQGETDRNAYVFASDIYNGASAGDWDVPYKQVYYANTALDALQKMESGTTDKTRFNRLKGIALFYRSWAFYNLVQTFALPYDSITAASDPGIALRLSSDFNIRSTRASVKDCYDQLLSDLKTAQGLLPASSIYKTEPSKLTVNAFLARIYLAMRKYDEAFTCSNAALSQFNTLTDYNSLPVLSATATKIYTTYMDEEVYHTSMIISHPIVSAVTTPVVDSVFYALFNDNDLRKSFFFTLRSSAIRFRGSYDFAANRYSGLANDEMYLIRAECYARKDNKDAALTDLNTLLLKRWKAGTFVQVQATNAADALAKILVERRKELCFRGLRWTDIRRLNQEDLFKSTITHIINGITYTLVPGDRKFALPIPNNEIQLSGLQQNPR